MSNQNKNWQKQDNFVKICEMKKSKLNLKRTIATFLIGLGVFTAFLSLNTAFAELDDVVEEAKEEIEEPNYLKSVINIGEAIEAQKSTIFDASQSFIPDPDKTVSYNWDFGDGNKNEGIEVLHAYKEPGNYTITLTIDDGGEESQTSLDIFVYRKLILLITDKTEDKDSIELTQEFAKKKGVFLKIIESYGSSTDFISEEVLTKKITEESESITSAEQIAIWTKESAGINALSRFIKNNPNKPAADLEQKSIIILDNNFSSKVSRIERQFELINPRSIILTKEGEIDELITSESTEEFITLMQERGSMYEIVDGKSDFIRPWNFMSYFVTILTNNGIPDNTIALLLLLPVIATVVAFMKQVVGVTTFGIYTPSIITLSFMIIGMHAGLLTLFIAILIGTAVRPLLKKLRMLFIPKMAIVITLVSLALLLVVITSIYLNLFNSQFISIAIFPMLILSTLVEKFVSAKGEKSFTSASVLMAETVFVALVAYFVIGGEIDLGFVEFKFEFIKNLIMTYPETIFLLLAIDYGLGKWSGLRVLERIRFREVLRHIEE